MMQSSAPAMRLVVVGAALTLFAACSPPAHQAEGHGTAGHASAPAADTGAAPTVVPGGSGQAGTVAMTAARIRPPPGGRDVTAGYLTLTNTGTAADRLLSATSPVAASIELHAHTHAGGMMKMEQVPAIDVPAGGTVTLEPGGLHLMLFGVKADALAGGVVPVTLTFEQGGTVEVPFVVTQP